MLNRAALTILLFLLPATLVLWGCPMEEKLIFYPDRRVHKTPADRGLEFDDVFFSTRDGLRLHGWFVAHPQAKTTLLWFHGNAGNISHRLENIKLLHDKLNTNIFIFDYRGYGRSEGSVSESGTYLDGEAAFEHLRGRTNVEPKSVVLFGRSLGAAIAAEMAGRVDSLGLILESPFVSIREMARATFPFLPLGAVFKTRYDVVEKLARVRVPVLVLHGDRDEIVPFTQGRQVFEAAPQPKHFYTISGAGHNDTYAVGGDAYFAALRDFVESAHGAREKRGGEISHRPR